MSGLFITFEGVEGCGKSTQVARLREQLTSRGLRVVLTREPGGTAIAEAIRSIVLDPRNTAITPVTELLLYAAARAQHVDELIRPELDAGAIVISDRFADSTTAYQGAGRNLDRALIKRMHETATRGTWPDITFLLDLPAELGLERARSTGAFDRIEGEPLQFHQAVREEFLRIAEKDSARIHVIDARQSADIVADEAWGAVEANLK